ncbi:hypothetical protein QA639_20980 [Bradyrhizobium pachyrhizi]|uniref:hypothetical protein n=1 Tax=Bradyrhizobium pachyrhizi TaxID=280333 RepID=UPI0024B273BC|nr:hypothetical protein [Bradyrhizobium pachyrhizi]WFU52184.1 hypothetical protein QA639_20980 [Bradyrhizobium pachyrhizi]
MTDTTIVTKEQMLEYVTEARRLLARVQDPMWAISPEQTDAEHLADYEKTLAKTREAFPEMEGKTVMNMVMGDGGIVYAFTGHSPTSADRAKALVGFIHTMPFLLDTLVAWVEQQEQHSARVSELLQHNSAQLTENRAQRAIIQQQKTQIVWLLNQIPGAAA